jgi:hypothetical protein
LVTILDFSRADNEFFSYDRVYIFASWWCCWCSVVAVFDNAGSETVNSLEEGVGRAE